MLTSAIVVYETFKSIFVKNKMTLFAYVIFCMDTTPCKLGKYIILILASEQVKLKRVNIASQQDVCTYKLEEHIKNHSRQNIDKKRQIR